MKIHPFIIREVIKTSYHKTKENGWFLFVSSMISFAFLSALRGTFLFAYIAEILVTIAATAISLAITNNHVPEWKDAVKDMRTYVVPVKLFMVSLFVNIFTIIGLVFLVLPGIYIATRFMFYPFYVLEHSEKRIGDLVTGSYAMTQGHFWKLFFFLVTLCILNVIGALLLGIGLLVTIPISLLAAGYAYKALKEKKEAIHHVIPESSESITH